MEQSFPPAILRLSCPGPIKRKSRKKDDGPAYAPLQIWCGNRTVPCTPVSVPPELSLRFGLNVSTCQRDTQPRRRKFNKLLEFRDSNKAGTSSCDICTTQRAARQRKRSPSVTSPGPPASCSC